MYPVWTVDKRRQNLMAVGPQYSSVAEALSGTGRMIRGLGGTTLQGTNVMITVEGGAEGTEGILVEDPAMPFGFVIQGASLTGGNQTGLVPVA